MTVTVSDVLLTCVDCGAAFPFTAGEQRYYAERGLPRPERCADCRAKRRAERNADAIRASENTSGPSTWQDNFGSYGGSANGGSRRGGRSGTRLFSAICSSCGRETEVPFEPRGGRPVYCRECFNARRGR